MKSVFADQADAVEHLKKIYPQLPETVIRSAIEFCKKNPDILPDGHETIDISKHQSPRSPRRSSSREQSKSLRTRTTPDSGSSSTRRERPS